MRTNVDTQLSSILFYEFNYLNSSYLHQRLFLFAICGISVSFPDVREPFSEMVVE